MPNPKQEIHLQVVAAIKRGDSYALAQIVENGGNPFQRNDKGELPIFVLASEGNKGAVDALLAGFESDGIHIMENNKDAIKGYAYGGHNELVIELLMGAANFDSTSAPFMDLFMYAESGYRKANNRDGLIWLRTKLFDLMAQGYLSHSVSFEIQKRPVDIGPYTDIELSAQSGDEQAVNDFLKKANPKDELKMKKKAAHGYGLRGDMDNIIRLLSSERHDINLEILCEGVHGHYNGSYFTYQPVLAKMIEEIPEEYRLEVLDHILTNSPSHSETYHMLYYFPHRVFVEEMKDALSYKQNLQTLSISGSSYVMFSAQAAARADLDGHDELMKQTRSGMTY